MLLLDASISYSREGLSFLTLLVCQTFRSVLGSFCVTGFRVVFLSIRPIM